MMNSTTFEIVQTHVFYVVVETFVLEMLVIGACFIVSVIVNFDILLVDSTICSYITNDIY